MSGKPLVIPISDVTYRDTVLISQYLCVPAGVSRQSAGKLSACILPLIRLMVKAYLGFLSCALTTYPVHRHLGPASICRRFAGTTAGVGESTCMTETYGRFATPSILCSLQATQPKLLKRVPPRGANQQQASMMQTTCQT